MDGSIEQLLTVDRSTVSRDELLDHVAAVQTAISRFHAELERDLAALAHPSSDLDDKCYDREEIACLLRWSSGYTQSRVAQAHQLVDQLPKTLSALGAGALAPEHARAVADASYGLETKRAASSKTVSSTRPPPRPSPSSSAR